VDRQEGTERGDPALAPSSEDGMAEAPGSPRRPELTDADGGMPEDLPSGDPLSPAAPPDGISSLFDQEQPLLRPDGMPRLDLGLGPDGAVPLDLVLGGGEAGSSPGRGPADGEWAAAEGEPTAAEAPAPASREGPGVGEAGREGAAAARDGRAGPASELGRRIATGLAFGIVAIAAFLGGPLSSLALIMVVIVLALAEAYAVLRRSGYRPATLVGLAVTLVMIPAVYRFGTAALPVAWAVALVASFAWFLENGHRQRATANLAVTILAFGWVGVFGAYAAALVDPTTFPHRHGVADFAGVVLLTIGYDVGAYLVGRQVGRHPLLSSVSPNKTVEGLVGGVLGAIVAAVVLAHLHPWTLPHAVVVAVVVMVVAPLGDLAESLLKRDLRVKDMGTLLPGHGGVLDRIDAILFVLPVAYYVLEIVHVH